MPSTVPPGLRLELSRAPVLEGREEALGEWMTMLGERYEECVASLPAQWAVLEATFRHREADGTVWMYHLALLGEDGAELADGGSIAADHEAWARSVKPRGWEELEPMFLLAPDHLMAAFRRWGATGSTEAPGMPPA